jgi:hypothetical protein
MDTIDEKNLVSPLSPMPGLKLFHGRPSLHPGNIMLKSAKAEKDSASIKYPIYFIV